MKKELGTLQERKEAVEKVKLITYMIIVIYLSPKHHKTKAPLSREHFIHYCEKNCISVR